MIVDRTKFLFMANTLALATGTLACDRSPLGREQLQQPAVAPAAATPSVVTPTGPVLVDVVEPDAPVCDDMQGTAEQCPSVGPSDEGVCPDIISKRCADFKSAMKPRVAAAAVACLRALKGNERCDAARINQCGHAALMSACAEPPRAKKGELQAASATTPGVVTLKVDSSPDLSPLAASCSSIAKGCGERSLAPTSVDCRQTLAGMTELGRANMVECVTQHCTDRGLYGCEAAPKIVSASAN